MLTDYSGPSTLQRGGRREGRRGGGGRGEIHLYMYVQCCYIASLLDSPLTSTM